MKDVAIRSKNLGIAAFFAYLLIFLNTISGFLIGPFLIGKIGDGVYGVYTTVFSVASALTMADVGVTQTLIRYIAKYKSEKRSEEEVARLCKTVRAINYIIIIVTLLASLGIFFVLPYVYSNKFSDEEVTIAKNLFLIFSCSITITIFSNFYNGVICGNGYFVFINVTKSISVVLRIALIFALVFIRQSVYIVALVDLLISVATAVANVIFQKTNIKLVKAKGWLGKLLIKELLIFTGLVFLQSLIDQVNNNLGNILIGAFVGSVAVSIYSFGLTLFHMFQNLSTSISQMLVPHMSQKIADNATSSELEDDLTNIGKIQFTIIGAVIFGFATLGQMFINLWLGPKYSDVWIITMILMCGGVLPLIQNGAIAILKAKNLMMFRTIALLIMAVFNAALIFIFVNYLGYVYAALGTSIGFILVNTLLMDIYYYRKLNLNLFKVLGLILIRLVPCNLVPAIIVFFLKPLFADSYIWLLCLILIYCVIYFVCLIVFGYTKSEKIAIKDRFLKRRKNSD